MYHPFLYTKGDAKMSKELFENAPEILNVKQLSQLLGISVSGAYQLINRPDFPRINVGGRKMVAKQDLLEWMRRNTNEI